MLKRCKRHQDLVVKRSEFYLLTQEVDESIEEWANKVLEKGVDAFDQVTEAVSKEELVIKYLLFPLGIIIICLLHIYFSYIL